MKILITLLTIIALSSLVNPVFGYYSADAEWCTISNKTFTSEPTWCPTCSNLSTEPNIAPCASGQPFYASVAIYPDDIWPAVQREHIYMVLPVDPANTSNMTLRLYSAQGGGNGKNIRVYSTDSFNISTITYNNRPNIISIGMSNLDISANYPNAGWIDVPLQGEDYFIESRYILIDIIYGYNWVLFSYDPEDNPPYIRYDDPAPTPTPTPTPAIICNPIDFSNISSWDIAGYVKVIISWLYDFPYCYITPFYDFITKFIGYINTAIEWFLNGLYGIAIFIVSIGLLFSSIFGLLTGLFETIFDSNIYAAITFSLILSGISLVLFLRVYNIIAGTTIWGFKIPKF